MPVQALKEKEGEGRDALVSAMWGTSGHIPCDIWFNDHDSASRLYLHFAKEQAEIQQCIPGLLAAEGLSWGLNSGLYLLQSTLFAHPASTTGSSVFGNKCRKEGWRETSKINFPCKTSDDRRLSICLNLTTGQYYCTPGWVICNTLSPPLNNNTFFNNNHNVKQIYFTFH